MSTRTKATNEPRRVRLQVRAGATARRNGPMVDIRCHVPPQHAEALAERLMAAALEAWDKVIKAAAGEGLLG